MKPDPRPRLTVPPEIARKLAVVRQRHQIVTTLDGVLRTLAIGSALLLGAMTLDLIVGWLNPLARATVTLIALGTATSVFVLFCLGPLVRRRSLVDTAMEIDQLRPEFEERISTVAEFAQNTDPAPVRGSEAMIGQVAREAASAGSRIVPEAVVPMRSAVRSARWAALAGAALLVFLLVNLSSASALLERFWFPLGTASLTRITASPAEGWVPRGEPLTVTATLEGRVPSRAPRLTLRRPDGSIREVAMRPDSGGTGRFVHTLDAVHESLSYRVRAGDGQTMWRQLEAVDRPQITAVTVRVEPPAYARLPRDERESLPSSLRVLAGSAVEFRFRADQPLDRMLLDVGPDSSITLTAEGDGWYRFRDQPTNSFRFAARAISTHHLENRTKPSGQVVIDEDQAPTVKVLEPSDDIAVPPGQRVDVTFEASDDLGLAAAALIVTAFKADGTTNAVRIPVDLGPESAPKNTQRTVAIDPAALGLSDGDELDYVVEVTDTRELQATAGVSAGGSPPADSAAGATARDESDTPSGRQAAESATATGDAEVADPAEALPSEGDSNGSGLASANDPHPENPPQAGDSPPPHSMSMRSLDAGQSAACQPRRVRVDRWAGQFDGEQRQKPEVAVDPVLRALDADLAEAQSRTLELIPAAQAAPAPRWTEEDRRGLGGARERVDAALARIAELNSRTTGTPYAFIGLQLKDIGVTHIEPAGSSLGAVEPSLGKERAAETGRLERAAFQLGQAREKLADLTRSYEAAKRDQTIADALQRLSTMHQVFLEDSQALLGSAPGPLNTYDRAIAEVNEEYAQKLRELLEEKRKILAELAEVLGQDPRLLRRYLATLQQQGVSYRDQLTLLARRQADLQSQVSTTLGAGPEALAVRVEDFRKSLGPRRAEIARDAVRLRENLETWLPLDIKPETTVVQKALGRADAVARSLSGVPGSGAAAGQEVSVPSGQAGLEALRALQQELPAFSRLVSLDSARLSAYIANRLVETETLITAQSGLLRIEASLDQGNLAQAAEIVQHGIAQDTVTLSEKLDLVRDQVASLSSEIAAKADELNRRMADELVSPELAAVERFAAGDLSGGGGLVDQLVPAFARTEATFDELMRLILAKLDEAPPPTEPGANPSLDDLLSMLEEERKAAEGLGIPCRPLNVSILRDWMSPGQNSGMGQGRGSMQAQAQARAAQGQAQQAKGESERLAKQARGTGSRSPRTPGGEPAMAQAQTRTRGDAWNRLVSQLDKDLLQGRDTNPPEQYREAIDNYFRTLSEGDTPVSP